MTNPQHIDLPEEAVEAAGVAAMEKHNFRPYDETTRTMLQAAAPFIRRQERERMRETLGTLTRFDPASDDSESKPFLLGNDPVVMEPWESGDWLNQIKVLAALDALEDPDA